MVVYSQDVLCGCQFKRPTCCTWHCLWLKAISRIIAPCVNFNQNRDETTSGWSSFFLISVNLISSNFMRDFLKFFYRKCVMVLFILDAMRDYFRNAHCCCCWTILGWLECLFWPFAFVNYLQDFNRQRLILTIFY